MQFPKQGIWKLSERRVRKFYRSRGRESAPSPFNTPLIEGMLAVPCHAWKTGVACDLMHVVVQ